MNLDAALNNLLSPTTLAIPLETLDEQMESILGLATGQKILATQSRINVAEQRPTELSNRQHDLIFEMTQLDRQLYSTVRGSFQAIIEAIHNDLMG